MRVARALRCVLLAALLALPGLILLPIAQTMAVYIWTPSFTLTMSGTTWSHFRATGRLALPDRQFTSLPHFGELPRTVISSEDGLFYAHRGFDNAAICAAIESNAKGGRLRGASTLTQQTARNLFLWQGRSWLRKGLEVGYTVLLEVFVPKDRILELYLNIAETGPQVYGMQAGAEHWFNRPAENLTLDQAARLTALLPLPRKRKPGDQVAREKARWIKTHLAPMPGEPGMDRLYERARANGVFPLPCP